jgi:hypothetical protein
VHLDTRERGVERCTLWTSRRREHQAFVAQLGEAKPPPASETMLARHHEDLTSLGEPMPDERFRDRVDRGDADVGRPALDRADRGSGVGGQELETS